MKCQSVICFPIKRKKYGINILELYIFYLGVIKQKLDGERKQFVTGS